MGHDVLQRLRLDFSPTACFPRSFWGSTRGRVVGLSPGVYGARSVAAMGFAAHGVGHTVQHGTGYKALFQLVTLPVELNASNRAMKMLRGSGLLAESELQPAAKVLNAAALTYVAAAAMAVLTLIRLVLLRGRD